MKKYKTLKLVYADEENEFKTQTPIILTVERDYAVGTLKHLSFYALTGSEEITSNPKTGDHILLYILLLGLSVTGFVGPQFYLKKKRNN